MSSSSMAFLVFLAAMTFIVGELCFFAYDTFKANERLRRRVDLIPFRRGPLGRPRRPNGGNAANRLTTTTRLRGDELEFARRVEFLHISPEIAPRVYLALRLLMAALLLAAAVFLGRRFAGAGETSKLLGFAAVGGAIGWLIPHMVVSRLALHRRRAIAQGLPDTLELLVIAVESGMSLEDALSHVVVELRSSRPVMAEELAVTSVDLRMLPSREAALRRLAERVDLPSLHSVVTTLTQTLTYGTPLADALRVIAAELRNDALIRLEERANQMPVLLTIPMIVFIVPSLFLIIGGPAFLKIMDVFSR